MASKGTYVEYKNGEGLWKHFFREAKGQSGQCKERLPKVTIIKSAGGSTHGLHVHLQTQHGINLLKRKAEDDNANAITDSIGQPTIPPTSVEAERAFSAAGVLCTKTRSRLSDTSLDTLCFLRSYFRIR
jgi:hypothetical protein